MDPLSEVLALMEPQVYVSGRFAVLGDLAIHFPKHKGKAGADDPASKCRSAGYRAAEYSLWWKRPEEEIIPTLEELGIGLVPYSPLGKGYLARTITEDTKFDPGDNRGTLPLAPKTNLCSHCFTSKGRISLTVAEISR